MSSNTPAGIVVLPGGMEYHSIAVYAIEFRCDGMSTRYEAPSPEELLRLVALHKEEKPL